MILVARKIIKVGHSAAIIIPPEALDHMRVDRGDLLVWDLTVPRYGIISIATAPPYITHPAKFVPPDGSSDPT